MISLLAAALVVIATANPDISEVKQEIMKALDAKHPESQETAALLIAIASIETESMSIDYPYCDGKQGEACNIGIYKMNLFQRRKACPEITQDEINSNVNKATICMIKGLDEYGYDLWLSWHRGGESWKNYSIEVQNYKNAIETLKSKYLNTENALTNNSRYTIELPAI